MNVPTPTTSLVCPALVCPERGSARNSAVRTRCIYSGYNPLMKRWVLWAVFISLAAPVYAETNAELKEQVRKTEIAFAKTLADRDPAGFASFLAAETIFMSNGRARRGAREV